MRYTGNLSVYNADLQVEHLVLQDTFGEDGISVKHGQVRIRHARLERTRSDAIDLEYAAGEVSASTFADISDDAIDLEGSSPWLEDLRVERAGDNGISAGQNSRPVIVNVAVSHSKVGVLSKDGSAPLIVHAALTENEYGVKADHDLFFYGERASATVAYAIVTGNRRADYKADRHARLEVCQSTAGRVEERRAGAIRFLPGPHCAGALGRDLPGGPGSVGQLRPLPSP